MNIIRIYELKPGDIIQVRRWTDELGDHWRDHEILETNLHECTLRDLEDDEWFDDEWDRLVIREKPVDNDRQMYCRELLPLRNPFPETAPGLLALFHRRENQFWAEQCFLQWQRAAGQFTDRK